MRSLTATSAKLRTLCLFLFAYLSACGHTPTIEAEYAPYLSRFVAAAAPRPIDTSGLSIVTGNHEWLKSHSFVGFCEYDTQTVDIDAVAWKRMSDVIREQLIFHELGHCLLGRQHVGYIYEDGRPKSIMYPMVFSEYTYTHWRAEYLNELFGL